MVLEETKKFRRLQIFDFPLYLKPKAQKKLIDKKT